MTRNPTREEASRPTWAIGDGVGAAISGVHRHLHPVETAFPEAAVAAVHVAALPGLGSADLDQQQSGHGHEDEQQERHDD